MAKHIMQGKDAELIAANYLIENKYQIIDKNYRRGRSEVDIIAQKGKFMIFVEVKSLKSRPGVHPEQQVGREKIMLVQFAATCFQMERNWNDQIQFDIIAITFFPKHFEIEHFKDAF